MQTYIDHYCERTSNAIWDEPLNVSTNIFFLVIAFLLYCKISDNNTFNESSNSVSKLELLLLIGIVSLIGIGSGLWHLLAAQWSLWADRIPILVFISLYLIICLYRLFNFSIGTAVLILIAFHCINGVTQWALPANTLNGSLFYIPTLIFLFGTTLFLWRANKHSEIRPFFIASIIFPTALVLRTIDNYTCDIITVGTHFLWHILVAFTIYQLIYGLILHSTNLDNNEK